MSDAQQTIAGIRALLQQQGLPLTTENLNRAMMAMSRNEAIDTGGMERSIERSMTPRAAPRRAPAQPAAAPRGDGGGDTREDGNPPRPVQAQPNPYGDTEVRNQPPPTRGERVSRGDMPGGRRAGTVNGAQRIDEDNPGETLGDIPPAQLPRQADETGVDQTGLALSLLAPLAGAGGGAMLRQGLMARARSAAMGRNAANNQAAQQSARLRDQARSGVNRDRAMDGREPLPPRSGRPYYRQERVD